MTNLITPWKKSKEQIVFNGFRKILNKTFQLTNGKEINFDIISEGDTVCALPITKDNKIICCKQFRPGVEKILCEIPAGYIEKGEDPTEAMQRELLEETGYQGKIIFLGSNVDAAYSTKMRYNFVITECEKVQDQKTDENEFIEVLELSVDEFKKVLFSGENTDIETGYMALNYLKLL